MADGLQTLQAYLRSGASLLREAGVETPEVDARLLIQHVLGVERTYLYAHPERVLTAEEQTRFTDLLQRRVAREPLPYLLGTWEFLGLPFRVTPAVLIPRPETETLVETVVARLPQGARVLDIGAGTGCVAMGMAHLRPDARVVTLDASPEAAAVARVNAAALGVADRVEVLEGRFPDVLHAPRPRLLGGPYTAVVSNPPYIPSAVVDDLAPEQTAYEPRLALDGGPDGLDLIRAIIAESPALLQPQGLLAMEVMQGQAEGVAELLRREGWTGVEVVEDLAGIGRVVLGIRP